MKKEKRKEKMVYFQVFNKALDFPDFLKFTYSKQFVDHCPKFFAVIRGITRIKPIFFFALTENITFNIRSFYYTQYCPFVWGLLFLMLFMQVHFYLSFLSFVQAPLKTNFSQSTVKLFLLVLFERLFNQTILF